jgi:alpha-N-arabinofuranosidase
MNRRTFLVNSAAVMSRPLSAAATSPPAQIAGGARAETRVAVLLVDLERVAARIDERIYGHFLEHINHSVVDGLYAEQIRGCGFEGKDFETYWEPLSDGGRVENAEVDFRNGKKSVRLKAEGGRAGIRQGRVYIAAGEKYDGSLWVKREAGSPRLTLRVMSSTGAPIASVPLAGPGADWAEIPYSFDAAAGDINASVEVVAEGSGTLLVDYFSMMRADARREGMLRPDLLQALRDLAPPFIRWPGGSFASTYKWKDGIGPHVSRRYTPNAVWGGYSDYYGFGTDEFLGLCRRLGSQPLIVLPAPGTSPEQVQYAMDWVHYVNDPPTTEWGRVRASNGHPEPYGVRYFQIDNEPMNNGFTPDRYAEIVNVYGSRLRQIAPGARIVACGQKRSNDMIWSEKVIDLAGKNFDILGVHNYEYEPQAFETGLRRIGHYLSKLRDYIGRSAHPHIEIGVLEWNLSRTFDWRAGLHAAGSLMLYEQLSPVLSMSCPALLMRNTTDDPTWTSLIYHDHVSWFPGAAYPVEKLFRAHYAERYLASTSGTFRDIPERRAFFDEISTMKPEDWRPGSVDAMASGSADGRRIVIKAVNYEGQRNVLYVRLQGEGIPAKAAGTLHTITARLTDSASLQRPDAIAPVTRTFNYAREFAVDLEPYTVGVVEFRAG